MRVKDQKKNKKITVYFKTEPRNGGEHQYAVLLAEILLKNDGFSAICGTRFWERWCKKHGIEYIVQPWVDFSAEDLKRHKKHLRFLKWYYWWVSEYGKFLRENKTEILLTAQQNCPVPPCYCKVLLPSHDLMHRFFRQFREITNIDYDFRESHMRYTVQFADGIITDSQLGRKQFIDAYADCMNPRLRVFALPFIAAPFAWKAEEEFIETPEKYIFYPAQFWIHKNHLNLVKAVELVKDKLPDIKLLLVGSEKNSLRIVKQYIEDHNLDEQVLIYGFVSDPKMVYLYHHATAMFMPSYFGPTNAPPMEAMALGCPVAVANNFAMPEQVGKAGMTFSPDSPQEMADCIMKIWTDDTLRMRMIEDGYKQAAKWTRKDFENEFLKIISSL